ncbi:hypothetical protein [Gracilibacillus alcaliphilus]|uniref:hypothetical protein n=1 Tax=Gracilibacillus alcaliphilus TaxID=1401441 RepID=UPI00195CE277|nr:hypothetical protein [Gracilibacillus alcaliphilus]MBM7677419.1 hypothetical protein [Gracilibacillus alcaliphilus]
MSYEQGSGGKHYVSLPVEFHEEFITIRKHHIGDDEPKEEYRDQTVKLEYLEEEDKWIVHSVDSNWGSDMTGDDIVKTVFKKLCNKK